MVDGLESSCRGVPFVSAVVPRLQQCLGEEEAPGGGGGGEQETRGQGPARSGAAGEADAGRPAQEPRPQEGTAARAGARPGGETGGPGAPAGTLALKTHPRLFTVWVIEHDVFLPNESQKVNVGCGSFMGRGGLGGQRELSLLD